MRVRLGALVAVCLLLSSHTADAAAATGEPRFPASVSDKILQEFLVVGRVQESMPRDPDGWFKWGGVPVEHQASAIRAVVDALAATRPPIGVAAAILAIARVESGWNPYSRNPTSTACGLFQFVRATWAAYETEQDRCFDPRANAKAGVKHLLGLYQTRVGPRIEPLLLVTSEAERLAWTYRMLYAFHYHGEAAPEAIEGGTLFSQGIADAGMSHLQGFFSILKRATAIPVRRVRTPARGKQRAGSTRAARGKAVSRSKTRAG
jgi:hypothetical protein